MSGYFYQYQSNRGKSDADETHVVNSLGLLPHRNNGGGLDVSANLGNGDHVSHRLGLRGGLDGSERRSDGVSHCVLNGLGLL